MPIIKSFSPKQNLSSFVTFLNDTDPNSRYFRISEFGETFTGGRNGFLIEGSEFLKPSTEVKIEILDVNKNPIYFTPGDGIPEYYEGLFQFKLNNYFSFNCALTPKMPNVGAHNPTNTPTCLADAGSS